MGLFHSFGHRAVLLEDGVRFGIQAGELKLISVQHLISLLVLILRSLSEKIEISLESLEAYICPAQLVGHPGVEDNGDDDDGEEDGHQDAAKHQIPTHVHGPKINFIFNYFTCVRLTNIKHIYNFD